MQQTNISNYINSQTKKLKALSQFVKTVSWLFLMLFLMLFPKGGKSGVLGCLYLSL